MIKILIIKKIYRRSFMINMGRRLGCALAAGYGGSMVFSAAETRPVSIPSPSPLPLIKYDDFSSQPINYSNPAFAISRRVVDMDKPIVILTGYNGRLGPHVVKRLEESGYRVIGVGRGCKELEIVSENLTLRRVDLTKEEQVIDLLKFIAVIYGTKKIASVVHLAGIYGFEKNPDPDVYQEINATTTENILHALKKEGFSVGQFVLGSSQAVYASAPKGTMITEGSPLREDYPYAASKVMAERIVNAASGKKKGSISSTVIVRIPSVYEEHCNNEGLAKTITLVAEKSYLARFYPGNQHENGWSYMHMDDFTRAIQCVVDARERLAVENPRAVFHIGEEGCTTQPELQEAIAKALGRGGFSSYQVPVLMGILGAEFLDIMSGDNAPVHAWMIRALGRVSIDTSAFRKAFPDYKIEHAVLETVQSMVESYRKDPIAFAKRHKMSAEEMALISLCAPLNYSRISPERFALCSPE
jgi:nucleoside-diphosphate-sugar epimerase